MKTKAELRLAPMHSSPVRPLDARGLVPGMGTDLSPSVGPFGESLRRFQGQTCPAFAFIRMPRRRPSAEAQGARAYAQGNDIFFGEGEYDPTSGSGKELIAHEVAHTIQQRGGTEHIARKRASYKANIASAFAPFSETPAQQESGGLLRESASEETQADAFASAFVSGNEQSPSLGQTQVSIAKKERPSGQTAMEPRGEGAPKQDGGAPTALRGEVDEGAIDEAALKDQPAEKQTNDAPQDNADAQFHRVPGDI